MRRMAWTFVSFALFAGAAAGQIASPSPVTGRSSSAVPLSETFTPSTLFPPSANTPKSKLPPAPESDFEGPVEPAG